MDLLPSFFRPLWRAIVPMLAIFVVGASAGAATAVFDNITQPSDDGDDTSGNQIGASLLTGGSFLNFTQLVLAQSNDTVDEYLPGETFSIAARNSDGTVGDTIYDSTDFTLSNTTAGAMTNGGTFGRTTVNAIAPILLLPNSGYWFIISTPDNGVETQWGYTDTAHSDVYRMADGVTVPATAASFGNTQTGGGNQYFDQDEGIQRFEVYANAVVPEPSSLYLLGALSGVGGAFMHSRRRKREVC